MPRLRAALVFGVLISCNQFAGAQDNLPPRFQAITKGAPFRLTRILGTPEIRATFNPTSAFSADGKRAIYVEDLSSGDDKAPRLHSRLLIWNVGTNAWPREIEVAGKTVYTLHLSPDGGKALLGGLASFEKEKEPRAYLGLWDLDTGREIKSILGKNADFAFAMALSPDGATAIFGSGSHLKQWDIERGQVKELAKFGKDEVGATMLAFLPGGKQLLANSGSGIQLWDLGTPKPVRTFADKKKGRHALFVSIARDGKLFATGNALGFDSSLMLWETETGKQINEFLLAGSKSNEGVAGVALADDGKTVFASLAQLGQVPPGGPLPTTRLIAWNGATNKIKWSQAAAYSGAVPIMVLGDKLLVGGGPNLFDEWSIKDGKLLSSWGGHKGPINALTTLASGDIKSAGQEGLLMTWRKGQLAGKDLIHKGAITALAVNKDRDQWLTAGADLQIHLGPLPTAKKPAFPKSHTGPITALAFSNGGAWAASGSGDRTAKTWDLKTNKEIASFAGHSEAVNAVAISPDDRWLATGSDDATIKVWPIKDGKLDPDRDVITLEKHTKAITCLTFTPDGKRLLSGSQDQKMLVWDWKKGSMDFMIPGHKNWINSILMLDAKTVLTSSDDLTVCAWNLENGMEIGTIDFGAVGDCPRCLAKLGPDRFVVGSSSWLIYEFQLGQSKGPKGSSK